MPRIEQPATMSYDREIERASKRERERERDGRKRLRLLVSLLLSSPRAARNNTVINPAPSEAGDLAGQICSPVRRVLLYRPVAMWTRKPPFYLLFPLSSFTVLSYSFLRLFGHALSTRAAYFLPRYRSPWKFQREFSEVMLHRISSSRNTTGENFLLPCAGNLARE